jgi:hypothetical protein
VDECKPLPLAPDALLLLMPLDKERFLSTPPATPTL